MVRLDGMVAIVTGAGSGIGRAEAIALAARGACVVVNDVSAEHARSAVETIRSAGGDAVVSTATVSTPEGGRSIVDVALDAFGTVDVVVNNAGFLRPGEFGELDVARVDEILDVHLRGAFFVTQPAWNVMTKKGYGRIVMTGSSSGMFSHEMCANYAAAKAGLFGLTRALGHEGQAHGIRVNCVLPYATSAIRGSDTSEFMDRYGASMADSSAHRLRQAGVMHRPTEIRRDPALTAALVTYLASSGCEVSGEAFSVCLGRFGRVFAGVTDGWVAPEPDQVSAQDVAENLDRIRDLRHSSVPTSLHDEVAEVAAVLQQHGIPF